MMYYFVRSVPLLVGVEAENENEAHTIAGKRVDDFMTDAVSNVRRWNHENEDNVLEGYDEFILEYHGDAIYAREIQTRKERELL